MMGERSRDLIWGAGVATAAMLLATCAWSFVNWQLPPPLSGWAPVARGATLFGWAGVGFLTILIRQD